MKTMKKKLLTTLWLLAAVPIFALAPARVCASEIETANVLVRYDADSTTVTYCRYTGSGGKTLSPASGNGRVTTAGSSTTVTSETASSGALASVAVDDILIVKQATTTDIRRVVAKASNDSVTVDTAVTWTSGFSYSYFKAVCGTTDNDGWIDVAGATRVTFEIRYEQGDLDNLSFVFQCAQSGIEAKPTQIYPQESDNCGVAGTLATNFCDIATAPGRFLWATGSNTNNNTYGPYNRCRVGFKVKTTDTSDAGANIEQVYGTITIQRAQ